MADSPTCARLSQRRSLRLKKVPEDNNLDDSFVIGEQKQTKTARKSILLNNADLNNKFTASYAKLTATQKDEHFNFCLKLAEENKITPKNVFGLHLINYMTEQFSKCGDNPNFQVAGITLQASTRIYSVRVDTLHFDLMHMAKNLAICATNKEKKKGEQSQADVDNDTADGNSEDKAHVRAPKKKKKKKILDKTGHLQTSHLTTKTLLPAKCGIFSDVLKCGHRGRQRLIYKLSVASDKCDVVLSNTFLNQPEKNKYNLDIAKTKPKELNASTLFSNVSNMTEASQTIEDFSFLSIRWPLDADDVLDKFDQSQTESIFEIRNQSLPNLNATSNGTVIAPPDQPDASVSDLVFNMSEGDADNFAVCDEMQSHMQRESICTEESEHGGYMPPSPVGSGLSVADVSQCLLQEPDDYRTLDLDLEKCLLMGKNILKAKLPRGKNVRGPKHDRPKKKALICEFLQESYETAKKLIAHGKGKHVVKKNIMSSWSEKHEGLFEDLDEFQLIDLFVLPVMSRDDDEKRSDQKEHQVEMHDVTTAQRSFEEDNFGDDFPPPSVLESSDNGMSGNDAHIIPLVPVPPKVKKDVISYAKISKKIDIKVIKVAMWGALCKPDQQISNTDSIRMIETLEFTKVYDHVKTKLPKETSEDVSVPIAFVVLLQLANEHNLNISSMRHGQLLISQPG